MTSLQQLSFVNCRVPAVVNNVLQHIPNTIEQLSLAGCALNVMCAGHLYGNTCIRSLDLSHTQLNSSEFVAVFQGMQMCEGIRSVRVRGARLDRSCIVALAEYIKLTHSLESVDLSECELTTDMCLQLVAAIRQNRTVQRLVFNDAKLTSECSPRPRQSSNLSRWKGCYAFTDLKITMFSDHLLNSSRICMSQMPQTCFAQLYNGLVHGHGVKCCLKIASFDLYQYERLT